MYDVCPPCPRWNSKFVQWSLSFFYFLFVYFCISFSHLTQLSFLSTCLTVSLFLPLPLLLSLCPYFSLDTLSLYTFPLLSTRVILNAFPPHSTPFFCHPLIHLLPSPRSKYMFLKAKIMLFRTISQPKICSVIWS